MSFQMENRCKYRNTKLVILCMEKKEGMYQCIKKEKLEKRTRKLLLNANFNFYDW